VVDFATSSANGRFRRNSPWTFASSSGKTNPQFGHPGESSGVHEIVPLLEYAKSVISPFVT
jgi:hypothetical protein